MHDMKATSTRHRLPSTRRRTATIIAAVAVGLLTAVAASAPAEARDHGHVFFGFRGFWPAYPYYGYPFAYYPPYDYPPYYYPPPAAYYYPPPAYPAPATNCRRFNGDASIDASGAPFYGTACLQADGRWHIAG